MEKLNPSTLISLGMILCIIGLVILFLGTIFSSLDNVSTGGIIFIGPIPIVFGSGQYGHQLIWIGLTIALIMILISYFMIRGRKEL